MRYKIFKITSENRVEIHPESLVEVEVSQFIQIPEPYYDSGNNLVMPYGMFYLRKNFCKKGLSQIVHTPFPSSYYDKPLIVIKSNSPNIEEILKGEELGEIWIWSE